MSTMQALVIAEGNSAKIANIPVPTPGSDEILVKVHSVGLCQADAYFTAHPAAPPGRVIGIDFAGTVAKLGTNVQDGQWKIGDRLASYHQGATTPTERPGAFAEYTVARADLAFRIPDSVTFDQAATYPVNVVTAAQAFFIQLDIPAPFPDSPVVHPEFSTHGQPTLLIHSAASSLGLFAIEIARLIKTKEGRPFRVLATASPKNHEKLKKLGVEKVFDYNAHDWVEQVKQYSGGGVTHAVDCFSNGDSVAKVSQTFVAQGGKVAIVGTLYNKEGVREDVKPMMCGAWVGLGKEVTFLGFTIPANPEWTAFTVAFWKWLSADKEKPIIAPNPVRLLPEGLAGIQKYGFPLWGVGEKIADPELTRPVAAEKVVARVVV